MVIFLTLIRFNFVMTSNKNNLLVVVNSFKLNKDLKILRYSGLLIDVCLFSGALILKSCCSQSSIKCFLLLNNDFRLVISSNRKLCRMMKWSLMNTLHYKQLLFIIVGQMFNSDHGWPWLVVCCWPVLVRLDAFKSAMCDKWKVIVRTDLTRFTTSVLICYTATNWNIPPVFS